MKKKIYFLLILLGIALIPGIVNAETIKVNVKDTPYGSENLMNISAERGTTIANLKSLMSSINLDNYILLNGWYNVANDSETVCGETLTCWGSTDEQETTIYLLPLDNTKKEYTLKSVPATNESMFSSIVEVNYEMFGSLSYLSCNDAFTVCTFMDHQAFKAYNNVNIKYEYNKDIQKIAKAALDKGLMDKNEFIATDTEILHYINYGGSVAAYVSDFKNTIGNINFKVEMDQRGGAFEPFSTDAIGFYMFKYNDTIYGIKEFMSITGPHVIYIPNDSTDIVKAIEKRLDDIFGDNNFISVEESTDTINDLLVAEGMPTISDGDVPFYILTVENPDCVHDGMKFFFMAKKDSSKINNTISFKSSDLITDVSVSTDETIPLDTLVVVNHITEGETYNELIKKLNIPEGEVFDISLKSDAQNKMITKLDNGKFLVSVPIPEKYNGKSLVVYYVSEDGKITEHTVTPKDGYATFETDHFSTYTLAISNTPETTETTVSTNPKTADNIIYYVLLLGTSIICIVGTKLYIKRYNK